MPRRKLVNALLRWFDRNKRDLPWRRTRDPYAIWVSEIMLQQTRVEAAIAHYQRFMARFPTVASLARADVSATVAAWAGLGYYRRARHLHAAAREIVAFHAGAVPRDFDSLRELPGIGAYTAGAISSIAFGDARPAVDGNVIRVVARWLAIRADPRTGGAKATIETEARILVSESGRPGDWNQALMELGALVCQPAPRCAECPVSAWCEAKKASLESEIPALRKRAPMRSVEHAAAVVERRGRFLLRRRGESEILAGLYEFPTAELATSGDPRRALAGFCRERVGIRVSVAGEPIAEIRHTIMNRRIRVRAFRVSGAPGRAAAGARWVSAEAAHEIGLTAAARKLFGELARMTAAQNPQKRTAHP